MSKIIDLIEERAKEIGRAEGRLESFLECIIDRDYGLAKLINKLLNQGRYEDAFNVVLDEEFRNKLYTEEGID